MQRAAETSIYSHKKGTKAVFYPVAKGREGQSHSWDPAARKAVKTLVFSFVMLASDNYNLVITVILW